MGLRLPSVIAKGEKAKKEKNSGASFLWRGRLKSPPLNITKPGRQFAKTGNNTKVYMVSQPW